MKKKAFILILLGLIFIPFNFSQAVTQNQINSEVQIVCPDNYGNWFSGSGTIIDSKGIILTNKHVVTDEKGGIINTCFIGFIKSINDEPDFGTKDSPNLAQVKFTTASQDMDSALLYLENKNGLAFPSVNIWNADSNKLKFGEKIEVIGYPGIGGSTVTYTTGDFSGFGSKSDGTNNYIKTTAPLEHGNSGGASYNSAGEFIGVPTMVVAGSLNSLSYILSINSIKNWLSGILGNSYKEQVITQNPVITKPLTDIQDNVTPPDMKGYNINYKIINDDILKQSKIQYYFNSKDIISSNGFKKYFYYYGYNILANPMESGKSLDVVNGINYIPEEFTITDTENKYLIIEIQDDKGNVSQSIVAPWNIKDIVISGYLLDVYNKSKDSFKNQNESIFKKYSGYFVKNNNLIWFVDPKDKTRHIIRGGFDYDEYYASALNSLFCDSGASTGILSKDLLNKPRHVWGHLLSEVLNDGVSMGGFYYIHPKTGKLYDFSALIGDKGGSVISLIESIAMNIPNSDLDQIKPANPINSYYLDNGMIPLYVNDIFSEKNNIESSPSNKGLNGKILLQVESHGEAWYVNPKDGKRYYMANGEKAYNAMRNFGVGITNNNLEKIKTDKNLAKKSSGKIFLQVEAKGEAYYIDFNGVAHYLKDGVAAYEIMRSLGLGITNANLNKISEGNL
jgi:hypothetical protein